MNEINLNVFVKFAKRTGLEVIDADCNGFICAYDYENKEIVLAYPKVTEDDEWSIEDSVNRNTFETALQKFLIENSDNDELDNSNVRCDIINIKKIADDKALVRHVIGYQFKM